MKTSHWLMFFAIASLLLPACNKAAALAQTAIPPSTSTKTPTSAPPASPTPAFGVGSTQISPKDGMLQVYVPAGEFSMGFNGGGDDEKPVHNVFLDAFWIDRTEVTNEQFREFVRQAGFKTDAEKQGWGNVFDGITWVQTSGADWQHLQGPGSSLEGLEKHPVVLASWMDASAYCQWAGRRLPTEAEWEKAARGTDGRTYPWGSQKPASNLLNFADKNLSVEWAEKSVDDGYQYTSPVGHYPDGASPYGAQDMAGNVSEWVTDWYSGTYYRDSPDSNPPGPATGESRGLRGGSWVGDLRDVRSVSRRVLNSDGRDRPVGFRCASSS